MKSRKILLYTHALTGGGAERVWALLASALVERGHEVIFAVDFASSENAAFLDKRVRIVTLKKGHLAATWGLAAFIRSERPDVSISALGVSNLKHFLASILAGHLNRCILSMHGYFHSEGQILSQTGNLLTGLTSRLCAATVCVSDGLRDYAIRKLLLSRKKSVRIYNPILVQGADNPPTASELAARNPVILAAGRLVYYKNYPMLLEALAKIKTPQVRLNILGEGPERPAIEAKIKQMGLEARVTLLGYQSSPWLYYSQAKCFALPSNSETFGNVVVEALAFGLPVVATRCHGPSEIIVDATQGSLVEINNAEAMALALDAALRDPGDPASRIGRAKDFSSLNAVIAYENLIEKVIAAA